MRSTITMACAAALVTSPLAGLAPLAAQAPGVADRMASPDTGVPQDKRPRPDNGGNFGGNGGSGGNGGFGGSGGSGGNGGFGGSGGSSGNGGFGGSGGSNGNGGFGGSGGSSGTGGFGGSGGSNGNGGFGGSGGNWNGNNNWGGGGGWNGDTVRCESKEYRYRECRADTRGGVRLARQLGGNCQQGRSWGWRGDVIWVNNGCRAEFQTRYGGSYGNDNDGPSAGAVIGGVAVAAGLLALLSQSKKKPVAPPANVPPPEQPPPQNAPPTAPPITGGPARIIAETGGIMPDARPALGVCLAEAARQIGATGGTEIRLDRFDDLTPGNGGYRFKFQIKAIYPDETRNIAAFCRATSTKVIELTFS